MEKARGVNWFLRRGKMVELYHSDLDAEIIKLSTHHFIHHTSSAHSPSLNISWHPRRATHQMMCPQSLSASLSTSSSVGRPPRTGCKFLSAVPS